MSRHLPDPNKQTNKQAFFLAIIILFLIVNILFPPIIYKEQILKNDKKYLIIFGIILEILFLMKKNIKYIMIWINCQNDMQMIL